MVARVQSLRRGGLWPPEHTIINGKTKTRRPNRLPEYDYAQPGAYFVTICTKDRQCLLSRISVGATCGRPDSVVLTHAGEIVEREVNRIGEIYENVAVDSYVIMPNHVHVILHIREGGGRPQVAPRRSADERNRNEKAGTGDLAKGIL